MAARAVYEQFLLTPLKLKQRRPSPEQGDAEAGDRAVADAPPAFELAPETDEDENEGEGEDEVGDARRDEPRAPAFASPELERLRGRVASADLSDAQLSTAGSAAQSARTGAGVEQTTADSAAKAGAAAMDARSHASKKTKRVTRAVAVADARSGREWVGTPSKAGRPPKRSRAGVETKENRDKGSAVALALAPVRRRITDSFADAASADMASSDAPPSSSGSPPPPVADVLTPLCDALVATDTISGLLFALGMNALRSERLQAPAAGADVGDALRGVFDICQGVTRCEQLAQPQPQPQPQQSRRPTVQLSPKRRHSAGARALDQMRAAAAEDAGTSAKKEERRRRKKSVRFRSFDLSCLDLQYVEDERAADMVDCMISAYGELMERVAATAEQSGATRRLLHELADAMGCEARLLGPDSHRCGRHEALAAVRVVDAAYASRDSATQHEVRLAAAYFRRQFERLASSTARSAAFLHEMVSVLISSAVRYKLRVIFLHASATDTDTDEDEADKAALAAATYAHQDVGAAVHRALQESLLYSPLASPVMELLGDQQTGESVAAAADCLKQLSLDDVERVDQFILARRFLRFQLTRALDPQAPSAELTADLWREIERACRIAERFHFEDEAHLFPLASVEALRQSLVREDARLEGLDKAVQAFWDSQHGSDAGRANGLHECAECRSVISRAEAAVSIACSLCALRFHLKCLHLPESFAQFAAHYTCPACFLGRGRGRVPN